MDTENALEDAVEVLQQLGLKEYEARCFVGLSRVSTGTAKELSEITDVPRTRVYDAIRVLEAEGLVEVQHSNPKQFRAVPLDEATETLRAQYDERVERLAAALEQTDQIEQGDEDPVQEVWTVTGTDAIANRSHKLIDEATTEVVLVLGDSSMLTEELVESLGNLDPGVELLIGAVTESLEEEIQGAIPQATTYLSGLDWLRSDNTEDGLAIGRLLLVDRSVMLVSTIMPGTGHEKAVFGSGLRNGLIVIARRLLAQGLVPRRDPQTD